MLILTQTNILINVDAIIDIYADNGKIIADLNTNVLPEILLGEYNNDETAEKVIERIAQSYGAITTFKMPKIEKGEI